MNQRPRSRLACWLLAGAALLQGCATAPGKPFTAPLPPVEGKGTIYLYRTSALVAVAQSFQVQVDGQDVATLPNASYLALRLRPGLHVVAVAPGGLALTSSLSVDVRAGTVGYYQYDFVTGPLANYLFLGSSIEPRAPAVALQDLQGLKGASTQEALDLDLQMPFARVQDIQAVPGLDERGREGYRQWLGKRKPRAFVLGSRGAWNATWGLNPPEADAPKDPAERAMRNCERRGAGPCRVYAVDDRVVWQP